MKEYGLKLGISNSKFEFIDNQKKIDIKGELAQSLYIKSYAEVYKKENTSFQIGLGYLERLSVMPFRVPVIINGKSDSITLNQNWTIESITGHADIKLRIPFDDKFILVPYFIIGPQLNYNYRKSSSVQASINKWHLNLNAGIGFDYDLKNLNIFMEAQQMLDVNKNISNTNNLILNQNTFLIALGIKYIIKTASKP